MNFTREPIIETVITPREGCKLVVRNSKGNGQEDYFVDAIEVVSFGHSFFFRSQERPKSFLVPVSDYEILELKETRMVLKNVSSDRSIKIGGGRDAHRHRDDHPREDHHPRDEHPRDEHPQDQALAESRPAPHQEQRPMGNHKRENKRRRGRRGRDRYDHQQENHHKNGAPSSEHPPQEPHHAPHHDPVPQENERPPEEHLRAPEPAFEPEKAPSFISKLFPPPPTLIKDSISRYKTAESTETFEVEEETRIDETISERSVEEDDNEE